MTHVFAGEYLDRAARLRSDPEYLAAARQDPATVFVPIWRGKSLLTERATPRAVWLNAQALGELPADPANAIFLGLREGHAVFALDVGDGEAPGSNGEFLELWRSAHLLPADEAGILAYAKAMVEWQRRHRFCGRSGAPNVTAEGGHLMLGEEGARQFPRVDPAIIVLVSHDVRCLLGRQQNWPEEHYSTIAGFVEPGESLEDAVRREVWEETNVELASIAYHSSQPWPFPSSLMVGYRAQARSTGIQLNDGELADARWFTRDELAAGFPRLPPPTSISFALLESWFNEYDGPSLRQVAGKRDLHKPFGRRASSG